MKKIIIPYPERECPATGKKFVPTRENHVYLNRAVQVKHNNEKGKLNRQQLKELNDRIKSNENKLAKLYEYMHQNKLQYISATFFNYEGLDLEAVSFTGKSTKTGRKIFWCLNYGYEPIDEKMEFYYIYKRK